MFRTAVIEMCLSVVAPPTPVNDVSVVEFDAID
jgi:hypothetical protein